GAVAGDAARARVGRERRPVHQHGPGDVGYVAPQAGRGRRAAAHRHRDRTGLPPARPARRRPGRMSERGDGASNRAELGITDPRGMRAATVLPVWMGSIRFRLTLVYSSVLFSIATF